MATFTDPIVLIITTSLAVQIAVLFMLVYGYLLKRKQKYRQHGLIMAAALISHLMVIFLVMIPSFVNSILPDYIQTSPTEVVSIVGLIHGIAGPLTAALGIWLVAAWHFKKDINSCFGRKKVMLTTISLWMITLILGVILYSLLIGPLLAS